MSTRLDIDLDQICIVMTSAIGDAVHVLPVVCALKRHSPKCSITWILQPGPAALVRGHPDLDYVVVFERSRGWRALAELRNGFRDRVPFDVLLDLQVSLKAGLITWLTPARVKLGFDRVRARDLTWLFTTDRIPAAEQQHMQDQFLEFLEPLAVPAEPLEWKLGPWPGEPNPLQRFPLRPPYACLVIGTTNPEKDWIPERWAEVAERLAADYGLQPVLAGGRTPGEQETEAVILGRMRDKAVTTLGCPLRELVGILDRAELVITLDTGPMHMAVALGRPVIALMGYSDPRRVGPYRRWTDLTINAFGNDTPITSRHRRGRMRRISVADVMEKVELWHWKYRGTPARAGR